jgi:CRISPR-associated endonuclease/helicase Cas3
MEVSAGQPLSDQTIARLGVLVFLHDIGKANSGFQAKRWQTQRDIPRGWPHHAGHGIEALKLFDPDNALGNLLMRLPVEEMSTWGESCYRLLIASISHHGRPLVDGPQGWNRNIWRPVPDAYDPADTLREAAERGLQLFPQAFEAGSGPLPAAPVFSHLFAGYVQLADWLGSDTRFFPYTEAGEDRAATARDRADKAIAVIGLDAEDWRSQLTARNPAFADAFHVPKPHPMQAAMGDPTLGPLVILESETGSGKTEAALWHYVHLFQAGLVDSLYFALPTRVAASQLYGRVQETLRRLWPKDPPLAVRALPGYVSADGAQACALPGFQVLWSDSPDDQKAHRRWAGESAKRFLAAPVAVGTIDQALLGALQVRHAHLRAATLARSLLVVDEVHASDAYMTVLLERLLRTHLACGGRALLLSATLGAGARDRYLALTAGTRAGVSSPTPFDKACTTPYPAISDSRGIRAMEATSRSKTVRWASHDIIDDPERIASMAHAAAQQGAKVLVIRNTVSAAVATLAALEQQCPDPAWLFRVNGVVTLHHGRFSRQDRPLLDAEIEARLGKRRLRGPQIVIGTQTLEQSLDIDADLLLTDLCPMDVLLQRIGRLHRHSRPADERPEAFRNAQVRVLTPTGDDLAPMLKRARHGLGRFHSGGGIYDDLRICEATRELVVAGPVVSIPQDNRDLVEAAMHFDRIDALQRKRGKAWQVHGQQVEGQIGAQRTLGQLHTLDVEQPFGETEFPRDVEIATRLGVQDRIVHFPPGLSGPFGLPLEELPIRAYLLPEGLSPDAEPTHIDRKDDHVTFRMGETLFRYSGLGLERIGDE